MARARIAAFALALAIGTGCGSRKDDPPAVTPLSPQNAAVVSSVTMVDSGDGATTAVGQQVRVVGTAYDGRAGAIVELDDRTPIYVEGLGEWDAALQGKVVEVTGMLRRRGARTPPVAPGEPQVHGLTTATFFLDGATWRARE